MTDRTVFRRAAVMAAMLLGVAASISVGPVACDEPSGQCNGDIDVRCDGLDDCWCGVGPHEGESCIYDLESTEPEVCEIKCCGEGSLPGPPSILRGTR